MIRDHIRKVFIGFGLMLLLQVVLWAAYARQNLHGHAWPLYVIHSLPSIEEQYLAPCIAVAPALYAETPERLVEAVRAALEERGVELRVAAPNLSVETGGYLDRECVEILPPPSVLEGWNLPLIAGPSVAYYYYDFNGDTVLLLQAGPTWLYLHHWSRWF